MLGKFPQKQGFNWKKNRECGGKKWEEVEDITQTIRRFVLISCFSDDANMAIFTGEYECKMDAKGRLLLPAKIKARLPECSKHEIILARGFEPCLTIYTKEEYEKVYQQFSSLSAYNPDQRKLQRNFFRGSVEIELDNLGRFLISKRLAQYAQLDKDVLIVGAGKVLEIWNPDVYDDHVVDTPEAYSELAQKYLDATHGGINGEENVSPAGAA
ncbi:MAG: division/cell wall cluster transcriptional repressor MraZ [Cyclobacteriaceae bacterium]